MIPAHEPAAAEAALAGDPVEGEEQAKYSNCCGVEDTGMSMDGPDYSDIGICPSCHDQCEFEGETDEG